MRKRKLPDNILQS